MIINSAQKQIAIMEVFTPRVWSQVKVFKLFQYSVTNFLILNAF